MSNKGKGLVGWNDVQSFKGKSSGYADVCVGESLFPRKRKVQNLKTCIQKKRTHKEEHFKCIDVFEIGYNETTTFNAILNHKIDATEVEESTVSEMSKHQEKHTSVNDIKKVQDAEYKKSLTLQEMSERVLEAIYIIKHEGNLYRYTGSTYKLIEDGDELLRLTRSCVSLSAFGSSITRRFGDLLTFMKADDRLIPENYEVRLNEAKYYVVFKNGVLDLRTMKLQPHNKEFLTFYELNSSWGDYEKPECFCEFLEQVSNKDEQIQMRILESMGYILSSLNQGKCYFIMGTANNSGKSTLGALIRKIMGEELVTSISTTQLAQRFSLGNTHGKLLNMSLDLPKGKLPPSVVSIIKQISGGDVLSVEAKYDKLRDVHSKIRFLFASNYPVTIPKEDDDDSFWDRMIIIPFLYSIPKNHVDTELLVKMYDERDAIISMCFHSLFNVIKNNFIFSKCEKADLLKNKWRYSEYDYTETIERFIESTVVITGNSEHEVFALDVYDRYKDYCKIHDLSATPYQAFKTWLDSNLKQCTSKRIHHTGTNPRSGYTGMYLNNIT